MANTLYAPGAAFNVPGLPPSVYTDPQFSIDDEGLRQEISQRYAALAKQLGYSDASGTQIPGTVELDAERQRQDIAHARAQAVQDVTHRMQQAGTLFSGYRGDEQAKAEYPHVQALAGLESSTGNTLSDLYTNVMGLAGEFQNRRAKELLDAIARRGVGGGMAADSAVNPGGPELAPAPAPAPTDSAGAGPGGAAVAAPAPAAAAPLENAAISGAMPPPNPQIQPPAAAGMLTMAAQPGQTSARQNPRRPAPPAPEGDVGGLMHTVTVNHPSGHKITVKQHPPPAAKPMLGAAAKKSATNRVQSAPFKGVAKAISGLRGGFG